MREMNKLTHTMASLSAIAGIILPIYLKFSDMAVLISWAAVMVLLVVVVLADEFVKTK